MRLHVIIIIIIIFIYIPTTERDVSGAAARVTATWRSGFRGFFSLILRERGNYLRTCCFCGCLFFVAALRIFIATPCALCKIRLRKTRGYTHLNCCCYTYIQEVGEAIGTGVRFTSIAMYFIMWYMRAWTYNLVTCELRRFANKILVAEFNIVMVYTDLSPPTRLR